MRSVDNWNIIPTRGVDINGGYVLQRNIPFFVVLKNGEFVGIYDTRQEAEKETTRETVPGVPSAS